MPNPYIEDRWADADYLATQPNTNDWRANRGNQTRRVKHQIRQAARRLPWSQRCTLEIARWRTEKASRG
jgi:hypothetical protein